MFQQRFSDSHSPCTYITDPLIRTFSMHFHRFLVLALKYIWFRTKNRWHQGLWYGVTFQHHDNSSHMTTKILLLQAQISLSEKEASVFCEVQRTECELNKTTLTKVMQSCISHSACSWFLHLRAMSRGSWIQFGSFSKPEVQHVSFRVVVLFFMLFTGKILQLISF